MAFAPRPTNDAASLAVALARCPEAVCRRYLPHGRRQGRYWVAGDLGGARGRSLFVRLRPPGPPGKWTDAATGEHGDLLDLIGHRIGARSLRPALDEARAFLARPVGAPRDPEAARADPPVSWDSVAAVTSPSGTLEGVLRTWLHPGRPAKAPVAQPRKALGRVHGHAVRFGAPGASPPPSLCLSTVTSTATSPPSGRGRWPRGSPRSSAPAPDRERPRPAGATGRGKCHNRPMRFFNTRGRCARTSTTPSSRWTA